MKLFEINHADTNSIIEEFNFPSDEVIEVRKASIERFKNLGLPNSKSELFGKTGIKSIYDVDYLKEYKSGCYNKLEPTENYRIVFKKGFYSPLQSKLPNGVSVNFDKNPKIDMENTNPFYFLSGALNRNFYKITVEKGLHVDTPIELIYLDELYASQTYMYITVDVLEGANVNLYEKVLIDEANFLNHTLEVKLSNKACITHFHEQNSAHNSHIVSNYNYELEEDAKAYIYSYEVGSNLSLNVWDAKLDGKDAHFDFKALQLPKDNQRINTIVTLRHLDENTTSNQLIKQIVDDEAKGLVDAKVIVGEKGKGTKAHQLCNSLILSEEAKVSAYVKPQLEIFIDELEASHGATIGALDEEALYYLCSRGISEVDAKMMLVEAFKKELIDSFPTWSKEGIDEQS